MNQKPLDKLINIFKSQSGTELTDSLASFNAKHYLKPNDLLILRNSLTNSAEDKSTLEQFILFSAKVIPPRGNNTTNQHEILESYSFSEEQTAENKTLTLANKTLKLFFEAFVKNIDDVNFEHAVKVSKQIVGTLLSMYEFTNKMSFSKFSALNDPNNSLAGDVYEFRVLPEQFARMSVEQMKSQKLLQLEKKFYEKGIFDSSVYTAEAETDMFLCLKCKQKKASYRQLQTRSADEPMTTYVFCVCGNTWKF